jgi:predicted nucleic acid-binding protein
MTRILLDTNLLARPLQPASADHGAAIAALHALKRAGDELCIVPQNLYEFYVVATRPVTNNGLGMDPNSALAELTTIESTYTLLPDMPAILLQWKALLATHSVAGKTSHDARIVAAMDVHGLTHLLTFNGTDFRRFGHLVLIDPNNFLPVLTAPQ